ncbi:uncharacterized MFS-type transporter C09D4.1-like [Harmonia axyridis]|uniref:uncharacterized MFS-type transporter C09D4.1-like n=1 Tax=Harmonia axyridis TaxID=115357 RepID=UPI001E277E12|nr:uncharacterized MFS-type transporter C09D4.1-like [Harmonia axyridis]
MESCSSVQVLTPDDTIKLYKYRWVVIFIFGLYAAINFSQFLQFTIIADILKKYYGVDSLLIDMSAMVFMAAFIIFFAPVGYIVENTSLKTTAIISATLTVLGNCLKVFATLPDRYYVVLISQSIIAISQIFMLIIPSKVASSWFGADEVSTACAIGLFGTQIGIAAGAAVPTLMVKNGSKDQVQHELNEMFIYNIIASMVVLVIVIIFFRSKPTTPPSRSQASLATQEKDKKLTFWMAIKGFVRNKDFMIILLSFGINFGMWNSNGVLFNQIYTTYFPNADNDRDLGILTFATVLSGGCLGSIIFGYILDRTHNFRLVSFLVLFANLLSCIAQAVTMLMRSRIGTFITVPINGFFSGSLMVISYEYAIETTYPTPEPYGTSVLNGVVYVFGIIFVVILDLVFANVGYPAGFGIIIILTAIGTFSILFVSPVLKRRNANLLLNGQQTQTQPVSS